MYPRHSTLIRFFFFKFQPLAIKRLHQGRKGMQRHLKLKLQSVTSRSPPVNSLSINNYFLELSMRDN